METVAKKTYVTLVRVENNGAAAVSVRNLAGQHLRWLLLQDKLDKTYGAAREHLEAAAKLLPEGEAAVAPARYKLQGFAVAEEVLRERLADYSSVDLETAIDIAENHTGRVAAPVIVEDLISDAAPAPRGSVAERGGKKTKSQMVRELLATLLPQNKTADEMIDAIVELTGFARPLAKSYLKGNLKKVAVAGK